MLPNIYSLIIIGERILNMRSTLLINVSVYNVLLGAMLYSRSFIWSTESLCLLIRNSPHPPPLKTWQSTIPQAKCCVCVCVCVCMLSCIWLFATPWIVACQALLSMEFLGKNTGVGCHFLHQGIFLTQASKPSLLHLLHWQADSLILSHLKSQVFSIHYLISQ